MEEESRILALDVGDERIGIAVSDPLRLFGEPVAVFERNESLMDELYELIAKYNTKLIVVGLPRNLKGEAGPQAQKVLFFVEDLKRTFKELEVVLWDERYTSIIAHKIFKNINISGKRERKMKDSMEAVVILESYIEYIRRHRRNEE